MRVLLVENNPLLTRALRHVLQEEGCVVEVAANGDEADHLARSAGCDLIILDLLRFRERGVSLLKNWQKAGLTSRVLALIAPSAGTEDADMVASGATACLTVPFQLDDLLACLRRSAPALTGRLGV